ncbi:hypothetical protein [Agrobacterium larrymoorei]|uniref:Sorbitol dehydrogenase n=1 Tax=Agrobacterium larrymoorei TaxID=160699 RepID=A0AAF0HFY5_9HYPH|nr:hypothetical protein [Agrobacterium larrymoorei]WHA44034.1 hypothetical protein CFBP5477_021690 [Agrobacterium larrymoorei]
MTAELSAFIRLSSILTGYSPLKLGAAAVAPTYYRLLEKVLQPAIFEALKKSASAFSAENDAQAEADVAILLKDRMLGPVLQNLITVWYTGTWSALPAEWKQQFGDSTYDITHVVSSEAYKGGLQWLAAGGHASGANHQGFAAWSLPPQGIPA